MTKSVKIGYVFRLAIIFTAVCCLISFASLMSGALTDGDFLDEETMTKARKCIDKMIELG